MRWPLGMNNKKLDYGNIEMFKQILLFFLVEIFLISCSGDISPYEYNSKIPYVLNNRIDIDRNGSFDVSIEKTTVELTDRTIKVFKIEPLNDSEVLFIGRFGAARLQFGDTIRSEVTLPYYWSPFTSSLARQRTTGNIYWIGLWAGQRGYVGLKIKRQGEYHCSWLHLKVDTLKERYEIYDATYSLFSNKDLIIKE